MEYTWNLDPLYHGFDDPRYAADLDTLRAQVEKLTVLPEKLPGMAPTEGLKAGIAILEQMEELTSCSFMPNCVSPSTPGIRNLAPKSGRS